MLIYPSCFYCNIKQLKRKQYFLHWLLHFTLWFSKAFLCCLLSLPFPLPGNSQDYNVVIYGPSLSSFHLITMCLIESLVFELEKLTLPPFHISKFVNSIRPFSINLPDCYWWFWLSICRGLLGAGGCLLLVFTFCLVGFLGFQPLFILQSIFVGNW